MLTAHNFGSSVLRGVSTLALLSPCKGSGNIKEEETEGMLVDVVEGCETFGT